MSHEQLTIFLYLYIYKHIYTDCFKEFQPLQSLLYNLCGVCHSIWKQTSQFFNKASIIFSLWYILYEIELFYKNILPRPCQQVGNIHIYIYIYVYIFIYWGLLCIQFDHYFARLLVSLLILRTHMTTWRCARYTQISTSVISGIWFPMNGLDIYHEFLTIHADNHIQIRTSEI